MKSFRLILEQTRYEKVKALYDNPGTPGEKAAAKAAMDRMKASGEAEKKPTADDDNLGFDWEHGHEDVLKRHGFTFSHSKDEYEVHKNGKMNVILKRYGKPIEGYSKPKVNQWWTKSNKHEDSGWHADTLDDSINDMKDKG